MRTLHTISSSLRRWLPPLALLAALVLIWEAWVRVRGVATYVLPPPSHLWPAFWEARPLLGAHLRTTLAETVAGVVLGAALGAVLAVAVASVGLLRRALEPLLVASQTIPLIVLAPLLVLWFGFGMTPKVVVVVLIVFFPVAVSTAAGLTSADPEQVDLVRSLGASRHQVLRLVTVPTALPSFFAGLRISSAYAVAGAVYAELIGGSSGLGLFIERSRRSYRVDQVLVAVVLIALLSAALFGLVHLASRLFTPWNAPSATSTSTSDRPRERTPR
ncbi:MAG: ABC transporter permease subunit [Acidimicrobiia bacterium]|nr:ABC transporter permease subunit [Acidimicrobiia bacterium]